MLKNYNENREKMVGSMLFKEDKEKLKQMLETMFNYRTGVMIEKGKMDTKKMHKAIRKGKDSKQKRL